MKGQTKYGSPRKIKASSAGSKPASILTNGHHNKGNEKVEGVNNKPLLRGQKVDNLQKCVTFLEQKGTDTQQISAEDLVDGNLKSTLMLMNNLRKNYDPQFTSRETADGGTLVSQNITRPNSIAHARYPSEPEINGSRGHGHTGQGHLNPRTPPPAKRQPHSTPASTNGHVHLGSTSELIPGSMGPSVQDTHGQFFPTSQKEQPSFQIRKPMRLTIPQPEQNPGTQRLVNGVPQYYTNPASIQASARPQSTGTVSVQQEEYRRASEPPSSVMQAWSANSSPTRTRHNMAPSHSASGRPMDQQGPTHNRGYSNSGFDGDDGDLLVPPPPLPRDDGWSKNNSMQNLTSYMPSMAGERVSSRGQPLTTPPSPHVRPHSSHPTPSSPHASHHPPLTTPTSPHPQPHQHHTSANASIPPTYNNPPQYSRPGVSGSETSHSTLTSGASGKMSSSRTDIRSACTKLYTREGHNFPVVNGGTGVTETNKYVGPGSQPYPQSRASPTGQSSSSPPGSHNSSHGNLSPVIKSAPPAKPPHVTDNTRWSEETTNRNSGNYESLQRAVEYGSVLGTDPSSGSLTRGATHRQSGPAAAVNALEMRPMSGGPGYTINSSHYTNLNPSTVRSHSPDGRVAPPVTFESNRAKTPTSMDHTHQSGHHYKTSRDPSPTRIYQPDSVPKSPASRHHGKPAATYVNMEGAQLQAFHSAPMSTSRERIHGSKSTEDISAKPQHGRQLGRSGQRQQKANQVNRRSQEDKSQWRKSRGSDSSSPSITPPLPPLSPSNTPPHTPPESPRRPHSSRHPHSEPMAYSNAGFVSSEPQASLHPPPKAVRKKSSRKSSNSVSTGIKSKRAAPGRSSHKNPYRALQASRSQRGYMQQSMMGADESPLDDDSFDGSTTNASVTVTEGDTINDQHEMQMVHRQLEGLETMYTEILKLLGVDREYLPGSRRSISSMSSTSRTGRSRRSHSSHRHRSREMKQINKRFARLESHVVTLARSVAHLSSEMRSQSSFYQEMEMLKQEMDELKSGRRTPAPPQPNQGAEFEKFRAWMPILTNPKSVHKLRQFFGAEPLLQMFLEKLGYKQYIPNFESEKITILELPYMNEERLEKIGIPMGPRQRILQEAQLCFRQENFNIYIV